MSYLVVLLIIGIPVDVTRWRLGARNADGFFILRVSFRRFVIEMEPQVCVIKRSQESVTTARRCREKLTSLNAALNQCRINPRKRPLEIFSLKLLLW